MSPAETERLVRHFQDLPGPGRRSSPGPEGWKRGDHQLDELPPPTGALRPAAVLVPILIKEESGPTLLLTKRNAIGILIGVELILNAAAINFVAFNRYAWPTEAGHAGASGGTAIHGQMFAIFIVVLAAAEAAVALAIFLNFYNNFSSIDVEKADELKG